MLKHHQDFKYCVETFPDNVFNRMNVDNSILNVTTDTVQVSQKVNEVRNRSLMLPAYLEETPSLPTPNSKKRALITACRKEITIINAKIRDTDWKKEQNSFLQDVLDQLTSIKESISKEITVKSNNVSKKAYNKQYSKPSRSQRKRKRRTSNIKIPDRSIKRKNRRLISPVKKNGPGRPNLKNLENRERCKRKNIRTRIEKLDPSVSERVKYRLQKRFKQLQKENEESIQVATNTQIDQFLTRPKDTSSKKVISKKNNSEEE